jgi:2-polyprenyl-3-methyl-5-hydroxy-6-metoxy-1,4-benzoquinol methylase
MGNNQYQYIGNELELFASAKNWKRYVAQLIQPYIKGNVLEVGAGIGTNTILFFNEKVSRWLLLEPDKNFVGILQQNIQQKKLPQGCYAIQCYTSDLQEKEQFDCILYIDVLEHIEDDSAEVQRATSLLKKGGSLVILSPAHPFLMSPFDHAIGHYRRYSKKTMAAVSNENLAVEKIMYADSIGYFASLANKLILKQQYPTQKQIYFWDKWMVPFSIFTDKLFFFAAGKTIIGIWKKK